MRKIFLLIGLASACAPKGQYALTYGDAQGQSHKKYFKSRELCLKTQRAMQARQVYGYQTLSLCEVSR